MYDVERCYLGYVRDSVGCCCDPAIMCNERVLEFDMLSTSWNICQRGCTLIEVVFHHLEYDAVDAKLHCIVCHVANCLAAWNIFLLFSNSAIDTILSTSTNHVLCMLMQQHCFIVL